MKGGIKLRFSLLAVLAMLIAIQCYCSVVMAADNKGHAKDNKSRTYIITGMNFIDSSSGNDNYDLYKEDGTPLIPNSGDDAGFEWTSSGLSEPAVYKMNAHPKVIVRIKASPTFDGVITGRIYAPSAAFVSDEITIGNENTDLTLSFTSGVATVTLDANEYVYDKIKDRIRPILWRGLIGKARINQRFFVVYDDRRAGIANNLYTKDILADVTTMASDANLCNTTNNTNNIVRMIQLGIKSRQNYTKGTGPYSNPWVSIPANGGDCIAHADWMTKSLNVLGIDASNEYICCKGGGAYDYSSGIKHSFYSNAGYFLPNWDRPRDAADTKIGDADGDDTNNPNEAGYNGPGSGTLEGIYVPRDMSNEKHGPGWNFHAASSCSGHWWEITFNSSPDHDIPQNLSKWPNGPIIKYPGPKFTTWPDYVEDW